MENSITNDSIKTNLFLSKEELDRSVEALLSGNSSSSNVESLSQLALKYYHQEKYELSATTYEHALRADPSNDRLKEMLQLAKANAIAEVHVSIPDLYYFNKEKLCYGYAYQKSIP